MLTDPVAGTVQPSSGSVAVPLLGSALGSLLNFGFGVVQQSMANKANKELAEYQYSKDLEMWERNNQYNSPEAQMGRLKAAGLNPNLVYGQGAVANSSGQMPRYQAPTIHYDAPSPFDLPAMLSAYQDWQVKSAQIDNLREQNKAIQQGVKNAELTEKIMWERLPGETARSAIANTTRAERDALRDKKIAAELVRLGLVEDSALYQHSLREETIRRMRTSTDKMMQDIAASRTGQERTRAETERIKYQSGALMPSQVRLAQMEYEFKKRMRDLKALDIDYYTTKLYGDLIMKGLGTAADVIYKFRGKGGVGSGSKMTAGPKPMRMPGESEGSYISRLNLWKSQQK